MTEQLKSSNLEAIRQALAADPSLANVEIPWNEDDRYGNSHMLHRICDGVISAPALVKGR